MQSQTHNFIDHKSVSLPYVLYLPDDYDSRDEWPLVIFLHGAGERGNDLQALRTQGLPKKLDAGDDLPFVVIAPQCPLENWWMSYLSTLKLLVEQTASTHKIDPTRWYITGLSMGGAGTWDMTTTYPDLFAAAAPICGFGGHLFNYPARVERIKHLPVWTFHGDTDSIVPISATQQLVDALEGFGGNVKFTIYPDVDHDSWTQTYANSDLYTWFLQHKKA